MEPNELLNEIKNKIKRYTIPIIIVFIVVSIYIFFKTSNKDIVPYNTYPVGTVLVAKNSYLFPYKTMIAVYKNGEVKKSKIVNEITDTGEPKEKFRIVNNLTKDEINELYALMDEVVKHPSGRAGEEFYGILIRTDKGTPLESASHYEQAYVDKLDEFIERVAN